MNDLIEFSLCEGRAMALEYDNGSQQVVEIERTQVTNGRVGVIATSLDSDDSYNILIDTSNEDPEASSFPLYRSRDLEAPIAGDFIPELPTEDPYRSIVGAAPTESDQVQTR